MLGHYLEPYFQKVLMTGKPIFYVDCFAGKGKFEDGNPGSPLIALEKREDCLRRTKRTDKLGAIKTCFIDLNYAEELKENVLSVNPIYDKPIVISGRYEEKIEQCLQDKQGNNIFLYIDPYGIKALDSNLFDKFQTYGFYTFEMLINFNSFGFFRDACRVMNVDYKNYDSLSDLDDLVEYEPTIVNTSKQSEDLLTRIAGGDYWKDIVADYRNKKINGYQAERRLSVEYKQRLKQRYKYVLDMPIRLKEGQRPKYRMIHVCDHEDGCFLMAQNMQKQKEELFFRIQKSGQLSLFDLSTDYTSSVEGELLTKEEIAQKVKQTLNRFSEEIRITKFLALFVNVKISDDLSTITYINQNISRNYNNPEEKIQAATFCELVLKYNYPVEQVKLYVKVTVGSDVKEADLIVYNDSACNKPHIIFECKKDTITELEFKQAVCQAYAYAFATAGTVKYIWVTSGIKNEYYAFDKEVDSRESISDIPQYKVKKLASYKFAKNGGITESGQKLFPLVKVEESELANRFKQAHQALWGGGELNPSEAFDELDKLIFCKIFDEKKKREDGKPYDFQIIKVEPKSRNKHDIEIADKETSENLLIRLIALYEEGKSIGERKNDTEIFKEGIKLNAAKARTVVSYLEGVDLLHTDLDSKGRAFETFMGSFFRGDFGQYFTPRNIVNFIVDSLPINENHRVLDTSCGSGGFLLHALDKVRKDARDFYKIREGETETVECHDLWHEFAENNLYGIEINEQISRTAKMNMIIHDDGHTNIVTSDGLLSPADLCIKTNNDRFKEHSFHFIITNPPFGSIVKQTEKAYLHQYQLATKDVDWLNPNSKTSERPSQSTEVLFIEQAENYPVDGGYLAIVIPDGILTNSSMQYVRDYISDTFRIVAVISMPQTAFSANGAGVKSSVLF